MDLSPARSKRGAMGGRAAPPVHMRIYIYIYIHIHIHIYIYIYIRIIIYEHMN